MNLEQHLTDALKVTSAPLRATFVDESIKLALDAHAKGDVSLANEATRRAQIIHRRLARSYKDGLLEDFKLTTDDARIPAMIRGFYEAQGYTEDEEGTDQIRCYRKPGSYIAVTKTQFYPPSGPAETWIRVCDYAQADDSEDSTPVDELN